MVYHQAVTNEDWGTSTFAEDALAAEPVATCQVQRWLVAEWRIAGIYQGLVNVMFWYVLGIWKTSLSMFCWRANTRRVGWCLIRSFTNSCFWIFKWRIFIITPYIQIRYNIYIYNWFWCFGPMDIWRWQVWLSNMPAALIYPLVN